jgi:3-oxo-5alpha-steroid 4-dehydrogenase
MDEEDSYGRGVGARPLILPTPDAASWDLQADVVVVGFGAAGAATAIHAVEGGAQVIALDRFKGGGTSAFSGGVIYAGNTAIQRSAGCVDDPEEMTKYLLQEVGDVVSADTVRRYSRESASNITWLQTQGVEFGSELFEGKTIYPPEGKFLYYAGNEKVEANAAVAKPAPRGHRTRGVGFTGKNLLSAMINSAEKKGVTIRRHSTVRRLIVDSTGGVIGVEMLELPPRWHGRHQKLFDAIDPMAPFKEARAERKSAAARQIERHRGELKLVRARQGVVLCTGGHVFNLPMLKTHTPLLGEHYTALIRIGSIGDDGSADRLGRSVGAQSKRLDNMYIGKVLTPPVSLLDGILVNCRGRRFVNETVYVGSLGTAIATQPNGEAWLILSRNSFQNAFKETFAGGWPLFKIYGIPTLLNMWFGGTRRAHSLDRLAAKCGFDPHTFRDTVNRYNALVDLKRDTDFEKLSEHLVSIKEGPCIALNMAITNRFSFTQTFSLGGLPVNEQTGAVLRSDGSAIKGLYAAGRAAIGLPSNRYISGLSLGDCVFAGRRAAESCLQNLRGGTTE